MAIQPIDLQTMYASLLKLSKSVAHEQQGIKLQSSMNEDATATKRAEEKKSVQKTAEQENAPVVKERESSRHNSDTPTKEKKDTDVHGAEKPEDKEYQEIKDPSLGQHIDVSG